jgi:hypothetical protein
MASLLHRCSEKYALVNGSDGCVVVVVIVVVDATDDSDIDEPPPPLDALIKTCFG